MRGQARVAGLGRAGGRASRGDRVERAPGRRRTAETRGRHGDAADRRRPPAAGVHPTGSVGPRPQTVLRGSAGRRGRRVADGPALAARARRRPVLSGQRPAAERAVQPVVFGRTALERGDERQVSRAADQGVGQRHVLRRRVRRVRANVQTHAEFPYGVGGRQSRRAHERPASGDRDHRRISFRKQTE